MGGEIVYTLCRSFAIQAVNDAHTVRRGVYLQNNLSAAAVIPSYFQVLETQIATSAKTLTKTNLGKLNSEIRSIKAKLVKMPASQTGPVWEKLYFAYTGVCYDYCGPHVLNRFRNFLPAQPGS